MKCNLLWLCVCVICCGLGKILGHCPKALSQFSSCRQIGSNCTVGARLFTQEHIKNFTWSYALWGKLLLLAHLLEVMSLQADPTRASWEPSSSSGNWCMDAVGLFRGVEWAEVSTGRRWGVGLPCKAGKFTSGTKVQATGISTFGWWRGCFHFSPNLCAIPCSWLSFFFFFFLIIPATSLFESMMFVKLK